MRFLLLSLALVLALATAAPAQPLGSLLPGTAQDTPPAGDALAETLRQAVESGVGVIVLDASGNVLAAPEGSVPVAASGEVEMHSPLMKAQERANLFREALIERLTMLPAAWNEVIYILRAASPDGTILAFFEALAFCLLMFGAGLIVEREVYNKRVARRWVVARVRDAPRGYAEKMPFLVYRFGMGVIGILVSMAAAYVLGFVLFGRLEDTAMQFTVTLVNIGYFCCRFVAGLWRMILSPFLPQYRIPALNDRDARRLHRWFWMMGSFDICAILFGIWIGELGLNYEIYALVASILSLAVVLGNTVLVIVNHRAISHALRHGQPLAESSMLIRFLSRVWAPAVFFYLVFAWIELTYDLVLENPSSIPLIAGAYGILVSIIVVYGVINYFIERFFARSRAIRMLREERVARETAEAARAEAAALAERLAREDGPDEDDVEDDAAEDARDGEEGAPGASVAARGVPDAQAEAAARAATTAPTREEIETEQRRIIAEGEAVIDTPPGPRQTLNSFEALARRVSGILAFVAGAYAFFFIWDNEGAEMVESLADRLLDLMVIIFIGYVVYHAFRIWIDNKIADEAPEQAEVEPGDEGGASSASRLATLLPLFRNAVLIVVVVTVLLIVLMELGVNVGPLFAGAGIVGVAIGFGSQALVRDVFAGAFFLFDDAFRKGEYLDVGGVKGTVEKISVRSFQLRHHLGYLHTIPFGELQVMTNFSRDWVMMKLPLRVTYDTDVEKVRKLIKKLGVELLDDPVIGQNFIQPLKSQGVIEMQDSAMIIRVKFMTKPGDQWLVRKRVYEEIRSLFEREGIRFAHREVTVRLADGKVADLTEEQRRAVSAAAQAATEQEGEVPPRPPADDR
jgi:moderate conductance mechanosensitive channel